MAFATPSSIYANIMTGCAHMDKQNFHRSSAIHLRTAIAGNIPSYKFFIICIFHITVYMIYQTENITKILGMMPVITLSY